MYHMLATKCLQGHLCADMACNFNCRNEIDGLLKVTGSHVRWKNGNVWRI